MNTDQVYEKELLNKLEELDRTREWLECELREVRNRLQRKRSQQKDVIDWSGGAPKFNNLGEWVK